MIRSVQIMCRRRGLGLDFAGSLGSFGMVRVGEKGDSVSLIRTINRAQGFISTRKPQLKSTISTVLIPWLP